MGGGSTAGTRGNGMPLERADTLATLLASVNDLVWCTSVDGSELLYVNTAAERIYGRPLSELIKNPDLWLEAIHPDDREAVTKNLSRILKEREISQEYRIIRPDGEIRWLQDRLNVVCDSDGNTLCVGGIGTDITDRKRAEQALSESETVYRSLSENLPLNVVLNDVNGRLTFGNKSYCEMMGHPLSELLGKTDGDLFPAEQAEKYRDDDRRVLATDKRFHDVEKHVTADGRSTYVEVLKLPVYDAAGDAIGVQCIFWDVTDRVQAQQQLVVAKEEAVAANSAKSDFLANMSHEIRTPMNAIIGMTELLQDTELADSQAEYVRMVNESGESLLSLINDILDFSKIEAGKLELESIPFNLHDTLGDTMKSLAIRAHRSNLELAFHIDPDLPEVLIGDSGRLRQVVVNLVGNAIKFTERGEVVLDVKCDSEGPGGLNLKFAISDTGIGIAQDKLERIFEAFEQADSSTTRRHGGTGLGLAICARLTHLMGGRIWAESEEGKGSTFCFTAQFEVSAGEANRKCKLPPPKLRGMKVLIVDDNSTNRRILEEMIRVRGMQPVVSADANQAIELMREAHSNGEDFPLVLTDVNMPDNDGFTLTEWIKSDEFLQSAVVMVLTSGDRPGDLKRCRELGVAAHLMKPVKQSELLNAIVVAFGISTAEQDSREDTPSGPTVEVPPLRILLAEDAIPNQLLAVGLLKKWNHTITIANNGKQAIALLETKPFDLVLMDVQMPEMDGLEATAAIRRMESARELPLQPKRHIPIIATTAHAMKGDEERCRQAGMDGYVSKPIRVKKLHEQIAQFYSQPASTETANADAPKSTQPVGEAIDWSVAMESVQGDEELLRVVAKAFLVERKEQQRQLRTSIESGDADGIRRTAHLLKGVASTFGAHVAMSRAEDLEAKGRSNNLDGAPELFASLCDAIDQAADVLTEFVNKDNASSK